jgi:hypothetical protein
MKKALVVSTLAAVGIYFAISSRPEQQVGKRLGGICAVAKRNIKQPERGVDELFAFFGNNSPQLMHEFTDMLVAIERIDDDRKHDERARRARTDMWAPLAACSSDLNKFAEAIENNEKAIEKYSRGVERFARTLEILFGEDAASLRPRSLLKLLSR